MHRDLIYGHLLTCFTITVWGATFISSKILLQDFIPIEILFDRFLLGFLAMWIIYPHLMHVKSLHHEIIMAIAGLFGITLYFLCENIALVYSKAANVGVIIACVPFFTGLVDRRFVCRDIHFEFLSEEGLARRAVADFDAHFGSKLVGA